MAVELGYLTLPVKDVGRATSFYGALFGWTFDAEPGGTSAHVNNTKMPLGIAAEGARDCRFLYFRVDDIAAAKATLATLGGYLVEEHNYASGLNAVCSDDQGTIFSLWQPAPGY
jgi:predicted enzyme related to lactoylglutathione lyase